MNIIYIYTNNSGAEVTRKLSIFIDYYGDDEYYADECSHEYANEFTGGKECSHDAFFANQTMKPVQELDHLKKNNIRFCCSDHGYVFSDPCQVKYSLFVID